MVGGRVSGSRRPAGISRRRFRLPYPPFPVAFPDPPAPSGADSASLITALAYTRRMTGAAITEEISRYRTIQPGGRHLGGATPPAIADSVVQSANATARVRARAWAGARDLQLSGDGAAAPALGRSGRYIACRLVRLGTGMVRIQRESFSRAVPQATVISLRAHRTTSSSAGRLCGERDANVSARAAPK